MIISYYILLIISCISILSTFSELTENNETEIPINYENKNFSKENESITNLIPDHGDEKHSNDINSPGLSEIKLSEIKVNESDSHSPDISGLTNRSTITDSKPIETVIETSEKIEVVDVPVSIEQLNYTQTQTTTDDMPTFDEYRQKLEKESKQKRDKADSIPSSPTMIVKDNHGVKTTTEPTVTQTSNKEGNEPVKISPISQETKNQVNIEKSDSKSGQNSVSSEEVKLDARTATLTKKLLKNNVAAKECGAKMLEFSNQITNADHVLNSNKDEYLNVPCSLAEKWFIVETCEPVQIRSIQIANFEMFSSRPKTFKVYSSDRYPVKHWYNLGLFRAHDEKGLQTFTISDSNMVKYIKFEMVDHYGNEHYCPLTFVRILGNVVIDEIDEEAEDNQPLDEDAPIDRFEEKIHSNGLLTKAKDILVKMVNGIGGSKKQDQSTGDIINNANKNDKENHNLIITESPCYFIDFLLNEIQLDCDNIFVHFQQFVNLKKYLTFDDQITLETKIISQPFPFQIRAEYFSIYRSITNTPFQFGRLHRSFLNLTAHSKNICIQKPWWSLNSNFKCNLIVNTFLNNYEPSLPNVTSSANFSEEISHQAQSTVLIPDQKITEKLTNEVNDSHLSGQNDITDMKSIAKVSTPGSDTISNETVSEELVNLEKSDATENGNKDLRINKTAFPGKEADFDNTEILSTEGQIKSNAVRPKSEEAFDQKFSASPGSNAWNQAFMRIKNMAKQLEVNVSISMKYLEELSQNYKQQTERLKKQQSVMAENVSHLENLINQYRQETQKSLQIFNNQLQSLIAKLKYVFSSKHGRKIKASLNVTNIPESEVKCDELPDELFAPSWSDSPFFMIFTNVLLSVLCNTILLMVIYSRLRVKITNDIEKSRVSPQTSNSFFSTEFPYIEELNMKNSSSRSCIDLSHSQISPHPVVLPPRGVNISFVNSGFISDDDTRKGNKVQQELGPHFYTVQPGINFVTPSKDRKKKRKK